VRFAHDGRRHYGRSVKYITRLLAIEYGISICCEVMREYTIFCPFR
jgi:hypothetical protein